MGAGAGVGTGAGLDAGFFGVTFFLTGHFFAGLVFVARTGLHGLGFALGPVPADAAVPTSANESARTPQMTRRRRMTPHRT
jgi:hypothetical protein